MKENGRYFPRGCSCTLRWCQAPTFLVSPPRGPLHPGIVTAAEGAHASKAAPTQGSDGGAERIQADQRSRLLEALISLTATSGYTQTRVGDLASEAGVSRATFYEQFRDKEECFLVAHDALAERLLADARSALAGENPTYSIVDAIAKFAARQRQEFSFLTYEAMRAGPTALDRRERLIAALAEEFDAALGEATEALALDVPGWILLGGLIRVLGIRGRRGEPVASALPSELAAWIITYESATDTGRAAGLRAPSGSLATGPRLYPGLRAPQPLPRGRHRLPSAVVKRVQRERILHATAQVIQTTGYQNTTVADIVAAAGISREVFYSHFRSRSEAFIETHQLVFEQMMAATAGGFFAAAGPWQEQVWQSARASIAFLLDAPSFANFAFVESYALGEAVASRTDDAVLAFTSLLAEGSRQLPEASKIPQSVPDAIVGAIMETVAHYARKDRAEELADLLPLLTYLIVAPFMGAVAGAEFVDDKVRELEVSGAP
jgi:AcrR family transcriptional regulator